MEDHPYFWVNGLVNKETFVFSLVSILQQEFKKEGQQWYSLNLSNTAKNKLYLLM